MFFFNTPYFLYLDAFESSRILFFNVFSNYSMTLLISTSMIYMFLTFFFFIFLKYIVTVSNVLHNIVLLTFKNIILMLYDVVINYVQYKHNLFFVFISYVYIYIFINNFIGLIPYSNTINNHLNITGMISFIC